ncbi:MAG: hypothetical protein AAGD13_03830 [Pseudomonadota bacterium]
MALPDDVKARIDHQFFDIVDPGNVYAAKKAIDNMETHLAGISGGATYTRKPDGKTTIEILEDAKNYWLKIATERLKQLQRKVDSANERKRMRAALAARRLLDDQPVNHRAHYRKMSLGEWQAIFADWRHDKPQQGRYANGTGGKIRLGAALRYVGTDNYRLWFSTSLMKCRKFENDKASSPDDVIMRFWFSEAPKDHFAPRWMKPHKMPGVQHNPDAVAWHREEFAEEDPNISDPEIMLARLELPTSGGHEVKRQYNLGFTSEQESWLEENVVAAEPMY